MKKIFIFPLLLTALCIKAQTETFDIASFIPPSGWERIDSNGVVLFQDSKSGNGLTSFCQIFLYPSLKSLGNAPKDFTAAWNTLVTKPTGSKKKPKTETEKLPDGWTIVTGHSNITVRRMTFTCMLVTATGFGKAMNVLVNLAGGDYMTEVEGFFNSLELDNKATASTNKTGDNNNNKTNTTGTNVNTTTRGITLNDLEFITPEAWHVQKYDRYILLYQASSPQWGCTMNISTQPGSGNLENDARSIFSLMYPGWQYRYTNEKRDIASKGFTLQGLEYYRIEADMHKQRPDGYYYDYEDGDLLVVRVGSEIAVVASRHNRGEVTCFCDYRYDYWKRFFNSFTVKNYSAPVDKEGDVAKRLVGSWQSIGGSSLVQYIFAANGHYQFIGAHTTTSRVSWNTIEMKTSGFKGDGVYAIRGNKIITTKLGDKNKSETMQFRLERVNQGSTGWKDRLYILGEFEGKEFEVSYEKQVE